MSYIFFFYIHLVTMHAMYFIYILLSVQFNFMSIYTVIPQIILLFCIVLL